jgi:signal transduction histidine kinase
VAGLLVVCCLSSSSGAEKTPIIFGYSTPSDGSPISFYNRGLQGFCGQLYHFLGEEYAPSLQEIKRVDERFGKFAATLEGSVGIQCGPSSKTYTRTQELIGDNYQGEFSEVFFSTQAKVLIKKNLVSDLYDNKPLRIGILKPDIDDTEPDNKKDRERYLNRDLPVTTGNISGVFPHANLIAVASRKEVVERLLLPTEDIIALDGYASDAIILEDIRRSSLGNQSELYTVEPPLGSFLREDYALVIYNAKDDLLDKINTWLKSESGTKARVEIANHLEGDYFTQLSSQVLQWTNRSDHFDIAKSWVITSVLLLLGFLLLTIIVAGYWYRKFKNQSIASKSANDLLINVPKEVLSGFSSKLHDEICQSIVAAKRSVEWSAKLLDNQERSNTLQSPDSLNALRISLEEIKAILDQTAKEARTLSHDIHSEIEDELDDVLVAFTNQTGITTQRLGNLRWKDLPTTLTSELLPVVKQALRNSADHSGAKKIIVDLTSNFESIRVVIEDNGCGFDQLQAESKGIGLKTMRERIKKLNGHLSINSRIGQGTTIRIELPLSRTVL